MEILKTHQEAEWIQLVQSATQHDIYHLPGYHAIAERGGEGSARLFVYREGDRFIALPLLVRSLRGFDREDLIPELSDATSVYGYAGPLVSHSELPSSTIRNFQSALQECMGNAGIVTVFSRLHPLLDQRGVLSGLGEFKDGGLTVSVDLTLPPETQRMHFRSDHKRGINKLQRMGMTCIEDADYRYLDQFIEIYTDTMRRVGASEYYFFSKDYFCTLMEALGKDLRLFVVLLEGKVTAAGLFFMRDGIIQYHLGGSQEKYLPHAPMKLLLNTVRLWGTERNFKVLHLGGGVGSQQDSLFHFKAGFSERRHVFSTWRWIVNQETYKVVCETKMRFDAERGLANCAQGYFPAYRAEVARIEAAALA